jgi:hypothetical protein
VVLSESRRFCSAALWEVLRTWGRGPGAPAPVPVPFEVVIEEVDVLVEIEGVAGGEKIILVSIFDS